MSGPGITFDDVALYFSAEEWEILEEWQKDLYRDVMVDHYQTLLSVGLMKVPPAINQNTMMGGEPAVNHKSTASVPAPETPAPKTPAPEMSPVRPQGTTSRTPTPEIAHNNTSGTIMNLRHKKLNLPPEIFPRSTRPKEKMIHKKSEVQENILEKVSDPDVDQLPAIDKQTQGEKPYICLHCGKTFGLWSSLVRHTKSCVKPHPCSDCGASFNYRSQSLAHHECPTCGRCFLRKSSLEGHIRTHTGKRPFICNLCNRSFIEQARLRRHERTHTGFRCDSCNKCFSDCSVLTLHQKVYCPSEKGKSKKSCLFREDPIDRALNAEAQSEYPITCVENGQACHSLSISKDEDMESGLDHPQVVGDANVPTIENVYSASGTFEEIVSKDMKTDTCGEVVNELYPIAEHSGIKYWSVTSVPNNHVEDTVNNKCNAYFILIVPPIKSSNIDSLNTTTTCEDNKVNVHFVDYLNPTNFRVKTKDDDGILVNSLCSPHENPPAANINIVVYDGEEVS